MKEFEEKDHVKVVLLFDKQLVPAMKEQHPEYPFVLADKKCSTQVHTMIRELKDKRSIKENILEGALGPIAKVRSIFDILNAITSDEFGGYSFCPQCLAKTILMCEEELQILKDIKELADKHAPK